MKTTSNADPRPRLSSPRLQGEPVQLRHAAPMAQVLDDPRIFQFLSGDPPSQEALERQYAFLTGGQSPDGAEHWLTWILFPKAAPACPIGFVQATIREPDTAHIAYVLNPTHWRKGYGHEAVTTVLEVAFTRYRVDRAIAEMDTRNTASIALARALGFRHIETVHDAAHFKGHPSDEHVYQLQRAEWEHLYRSGDAPGK